MADYDKELNELVPPGFSIEKYDNSKTLDINSWSINILKRAYVNDFINDPNCVELIFATGWDGEDLASLGDAPASKDYFDLNKANIDKGFVISEYQEIHTREDLEIVVPLTMAGAISIIEQAKETPQDWGDNSEHMAVKDNNPYGNIGLACAVVNIFAPDEIIVEQFKTWLKEEREKIKFTETFEEKRKVITSATLRRWHDKRVIPYIDLMQWHALNGTKIKKHQIAKILFPDEVNRNAVDIINKTTPKLAKTIFSIEVQYALGIQSSYEKWKENK